MSNPYYRYVVTSPNNTDFFRKKKDAHKFARFMAIMSDYKITVTDRNSHKNQARIITYVWSEKYNDVTMDADGV